MAGRLPPNARTPLMRGPHPNAESTPIPRSLSRAAGQQPLAGTRVETNRDGQKRLAPSRIEEASERYDSQSMRQPSRTQRRRVDSGSSSASASASTSNEESEPSRSEAAKRYRDTNRNIDLQRRVAGDRVTTNVAKNPARVPLPSSRGDGTAKRRVSNSRGAPRVAGKTTRRRARPYARALREIRRFRTMHGPEAYGLLIRRAPFSRLVREVTNEVRDTHRLSEPIRWHVEALMALQEASEALLAHFFEDTNVLAAHARRITVMNRDAHTLMRLRQDR